MASSKISRQGHAVFRSDYHTVNPSPRSRLWVWVARRTCIDPPTWSFSLVICHLSSVYQLQNASVSSVYQANPPRLRLVKKQRLAYKTGLQHISLIDADGSEKCMLTLYFSHAYTIDIVGPSCGAALCLLHMPEYPPPLSQRPCIRSSTYVVPDHSVSAQGAEASERQVEHSTMP
jgi:hypothetical protein